MIGEGAGLHIGFDARFVTSKPRRGIGNYSLGLLHELVKRLPDARITLYINAPDDAAELPQASNVKIVRLGWLIYPLWEQIGLPLALLRDQVDTLHCLGNTAPLLLPKSVSLVLTLHDVMYLKSGENVPKPKSWYQRFGKIYRSFVSVRAARLASHIVTVSEYSKGDILASIKGINADRVLVTHQSCDAAFLFQGGAKTRNDSFFKIFALGARDPRKNTKRLIEAFSLLAKGADLDVHLVIGGYEGWRESDAYACVKQEGLEDRVKFLDFISTAELINHFREADLFFYPSLYEGFGIPLLEAFACRCPVAASNTTSLPEIGGDAVLYFDPMSVRDMVRAMVDVLQSPRLAEDLVKRGGERLAEFTWSAVAERTLMAYERPTQ